jgi:hypothetical protein
MTLTPRAGPAVHDVVHGVSLPAAGLGRAPVRGEGRLPKIDVWWQKVVEGMIGAIVLNFL